ncbi:hypothetical protein [Plantactinospora sp. BB1]|uniref:hypothetical protein n=1 Tax=Plantactinospora sp. BB1 TaxID=2071627 RepID=UPI00131F23C2|nr:hypothetical protein [Plantactinospora sp. BB1]
MTRERDRWLPWWLAGYALFGLTTFVLVAVVVSVTYDPPARRCRRATRRSASR